MKRSIYLFMLFSMILSSTFVLTGSIYAFSPNGETRMGVVYLFQKTESPDAPWPIVQGGAWGMMRYSLWGDTFNFHFKGRKLQPGVSYTLIYYPDPWPGNKLICLGSDVANKSGNIRIADHNFDIQTSLPAPYDANFVAAYPSGAVGAKIWLVLGRDVDCEGDQQGDPQMIGWNQDQYLFEQNLINFEYRVQGQQQNTVSVLTPNGGEAMPSGSTRTVRWGACPEAMNFDLLYSIDNGLTWITMANNVASRSYNWFVPIPTTNLNECLVKVIGYDSSGRAVGEDTSDAPFTTEVVKVTSPIGGETLTPNGTWLITWKTNETARPVANAFVYRSRDAGATWRLIAVLPGNPESYLWTVPLVRTLITTGKIGVVLRDDTGRMLGFDISDNNVIVEP